LAGHAESALIHDKASFAVQRRATGLFVIIVIIIVIGVEPTGLRIHFHLAGLPVFRASCFQVPTVTRDLHVRPTVGLQLLPYLIFGHRFISSDEDWAFGRFRHHHCETDAPG
jgi:hypothetical protein